MKKYYSFKRLYRQNDKYWYNGLVLENIRGEYVFWFIEVIKRAFDFGGRSSRKEFWMYTLFYFIFNVILTIVDRMLGWDITNEYGVLTGLFMLILLIPSIAVLVRRLHDTGRSSWRILIILIPFIGVIVILVFAVLDSEPGSNSYGPNPKTT